MRSIYAELASEQVKLRVRPALSAAATRTSFEALRADWTEVAGNTFAGRGYDMAVAGDGALLIVRVAAGQCQLLRVANPAAAAGWAAASWTNLGAASAGVVPSVFTHPQSPALSFVAWANAGDTALVWASSSDYGATWGAAATITTFAGGPALVALAFAMRKSGGTDRFIFMATRNAGVISWWVISRTAGGPWPAAPTAIATGWPAATTVNGLDAVWEDDWLLLAGGQTSAAGNGARLWWLVYGDGGTYVAGAAASGTLEQTDTAGFLYVGPRLVAGEHIRAGYLQSWTGAGAYRRQQVMTLVGAGASFNAGDWTEPEPFPYEPAGDYSLCLAALHSPTNRALWAMGPADRAYQGVLGASVSIGARLGRYDFREDADSCRLSVELDNADGALDDCGVAGDAYAALKVGAMLQLSHGLSIAGVARTDPLPWHQIERIEREHDGRGRKRLRLECVGWWDLLAGWRAGRLYQWPAGSATLAAMASRLCARVGLTFAASPAGGDALYAAMQPAHILPPGTSGSAALRRLIELGPDVAAFDGASGARHRSIPRDEPAVYAVGGADDHPIILGHFVEGGIARNAVEVAGAAGALGAAMEYPSIWGVGVRREHISEGAYATSADAATRAAGEIEKAAQVSAAAGWIDCFPIHGLEMWDVLQVTYALQGIAGRRYRVVSIREVYDAAPALYRQRIGLVALE